MWLRQEKCKCTATVHVNSIGSEFQTAISFFYLERVNRGFIKDIVKFGAMNGRNHSNYYLFDIVDKNYLLIFLIEYKLDENDQNINEYNILFLLKIRQNYKTLKY